MIHRSYVSVVLVVTFVSAVSFRSFRFGVLGFSTCPPCIVGLLDCWIIGLLAIYPSNCNC